MKTRKDTRKKASPDITVHLGLRQELAERIDRQAAQENRTRVNMIATLVERALAKYETEEVTA